MRYRERDRERKREREREGEGERERVRERERKRERENVQFTYRAPLYVRDIFGAERVSIYSLHSQNDSDYYMNDWRRDELTYINRDRKK